jgi:hypothetical protein
MVQLNLVMTTAEGRFPISIAYNDTILYVTLPDTVETYKVVKRTPYRQGEIVGLERGILKIEEKIVYLKLYDSTRELLLIRDPIQWRYLKKRLMRTTKIKD